MRLPLAVEVVSRDGTLGRDATLKNGLVEANGEDFILRKRPGMYDIGSIGAGAAQVLAPWQGKLVGVAGDLITSSEVITGTGEGGKTLSYPGQGITYGIASSGAYGVAILDDYGLYRTTDTGESWSPVLSLSGVTTIAFGNGRFVTVVTAATTNDIRYSSDNGASWSSATSGASGSVQKRIYFAGGTFFLLGQNGTLYTSSDGVSWTNRSIVTTNDLFGVAHNGTTWVIGTAQSFVYTATALSSWTSNATPSAIGVNAYGNGIFIGSDNSDIYTSADGATWALSHSTGGSIITDIAYFDGAFWAKFDTGANAIVSINGSSWSTVPLSDHVSGANYTTMTTFSAGLYLGAYTSAGDIARIYRMQIVSTEEISVVTSLSLSPTTADLDLFWNLSGAAASSQYLFLKNAEQGFLLDSTLTLSEITDGDYPSSTVPGVVWLDGTFYVMDATARIYGSDLNNPAAWNALNFITAIKEPGAGVAIAKSQNYVIAFKEWSKELFFDAGNATGSPLSPVDNGFSLVGCASGMSVTDVDGTLFWVSQTKQNGRGVHMMIGLEEKEITTPSIQRILNRDDLSSVSAYGLRIGGAICYILTLKDTGVTLVYNAQSGKWSEWSSLTAKAAKSCTITQTLGIATATCTAHGLNDGDPVLIAGSAQGEYNGRHQVMVIDSNTFAFSVPETSVSPATGTITATGYTPSYFKLTKHVKALGRDLLLHESNGHIYTPKDLSGSDDAPIDCNIRTGKFDGDTTQRKTCSRVEVVGNKVDSDAMLRWSDDDYQTHSKYRRIDLSADRAQITRCGSFRRRSFELRHVADTPLQLVALEIDLGA